MTDTIEALLAEREAAYRAWQQDVFNPETGKALERIDDRLRAANRVRGEAEGAEYPSNATYYADEDDVSGGERDVEHWG